MFKHIKLAVLGLVAASATLPVASPANAALSKTAQGSVAEIQTEVPKEELIAGRRDRVRRVRVYRRHPRHRDRVRRVRVYRRRPRHRRDRVRRVYRRPVRVIRRRTCNRYRYRTVCRYRTYRRY